MFLMLTAFHPSSLRHAYVALVLNQSHIPQHGTLERLMHCLCLQADMITSGGSFVAYKLSARHLIHMSGKWPICHRTMTQGSGVISKKVLLTCHYSDALLQTKALQQWLGTHVIAVSLGTCLGVMVQGCLSLLTPNATHLVASERHTSIKAIPHVHLQQTREFMPTGPTSHQAAMAWPAGGHEYKAGKFRTGGPEALHRRFDTLSYSSSWFCMAELGSPKWCQP